MRIIRASEIGQYVFCHRAWWLRTIQGEQSANVPQMQVGTRAHERHGAQVTLARGLVFVGYAALATAVFLTLLWLVGN